MRKWRRWLFVLIAGVACLGVAYVIVGVVLVRFIVNLWWFDALHYQAYFWMRLLYRYAVLAGATLVFFAIFFLNFWIGSRYLGVGKKTRDSKATVEVGVPRRTTFGMFRSFSLKVYTPVSLVLGVAVAYPLFDRWETALFYIFGPDTGFRDPIFGKDAGYYLFSFPIYILLQHRLLIAFAVLFVALLFLYWLEHRLLSGENRHLPRGAKLHLSVLLLLIVLVQDWGYVLERHQLVYTTTHEPYFSGPGFTEMWVTLPLIWACLVLFSAMALSLARVIHTRRGYVAAIVLAALFAGVTVLRDSTVLSDKVEKYIVKPNEITRERPFIEANIESTLSSYALDDVEIRKFETERIPWTVTPKVKGMLRNIPVWDKEVLDEVYKQLQGIRPYYDFVSTDVDRYTLGRVYQQVYLAGREINTRHLPEYAQNWVNLHLQYTHGNGVVMTPAAQAGDEFMAWFIQDIPPVSRYGLTPEQTGIYYGLEDYSYVIAPNSVGEFDYPKGQSNVLSNYRGTGGVPLSSLFRKLLLAVFFKDKNIFFTTKTTYDSRILFRRNILRRIRTLTPYFLLDSDPYMVVTPKRLFWIEDAFTVSQWYPDSQRFGGPFNYIRDSLKIVVDAYTGKVTYYIVEPDDPIMEAYRRMYPGVFQSLDEMPAELRKHIRYPEDLFKIQMHIYGKYHQKDPELFYRQEDIWDFPTVYRDHSPLKMRPYYLTLNLLQPERTEFLLLSPMSPKGRDNLRALAAAGCDGDHYGKIVVFSFSTEEQVYGPSQIDALINQETTIAKEFALWNQVGSKVTRGRMILIPIGNVIIYIEPVYLRASTRLHIPELKRLIVSQGDVIVMEPSLEDAFKRAEENLKSRTQRLKERFPIPVQPEPEPKEKPGAQPPQPVVHH